MNNRKNHPYRVPKDLGRCKDCGRVTRLHGGYCVEHAIVHGIPVKRRFGQMVSLERRK